MKEPVVSRRRYLRTTTLALGALPSLAVWTNAVFAESAAPPAPNSEAGSGPKMKGDLHRQIFPEHGDLVRRRSQAARQQIEDSLHGDQARPVVLGVFQMRNHCDGETGKRENLEHMLTAIERAAREKGQILVFPEMCLPGYYTPINGSPAEARKANRALADTLDESAYLRALQEGARKAEMVVTFGFCLKEKEKYFDALGAIDADGTWLGVRRKNPLYPWPYEIESFDQPDAAERSAVFATRYGKIAVANCFDGEFPETIRRMRLAGAEILLWSNAAIGDSKMGNSNRLGYCGCHALANHMWVACSNCAAPNSSGSSMIVSPTGEPLVILPPEGEGFGLATINLALSDDWSTWRDRLDPHWER